MLNKLCKCAYETLKQKEAEYSVLLEENQAFVCAEYRPDWRLLGLDFDNEAHHPLLIALDDFFIDTCLNLAKRDEGLYVVVLANSESKRKKRLSSALSREECGNLLMRLSESDLYDPQSLLVERADDWRLHNLPFPEVLAETVLFSTR